MQTFIKEKGDNQEDEDGGSEEEEEEEEEEEQDQFSGSSEVSQHKDKSINRSIEQVRNLMKNAEELDGEEQLDKSMSGNVGVIGGIKTKQQEPKSDQKKYSNGKNQYSLGFQMSHKANYPQMHYDQGNSNVGYGYRPGKIGPISGLQQGLREISTPKLFSKMFDRKTDMNVSQESDHLSQNRFQQYGGHEMNDRPIQGNNFHDGREPVYSSYNNIGAEEYAAQAANRNLGYEQEEYAVQYQPDLGINSYHQEQNFPRQINLEYQGDYQNEYFANPSRYDENQKNPAYRHEFSSDMQYGRQYGDQYYGQQGYDYYPNNGYYPQHSGFNGAYPYEYQDQGQYQGVYGPEKGYQEPERYATGNYNPTGYYQGQNPNQANCDGKIQ